MKLINIISHRGFWYKQTEKNTMDSFKRSFDNGFGIETDVRDSNEKLVISHDVPINNSLLTLEELLILYKRYKNDLPLFLNIKSDGIKDLINNLLSDFKITNYCLFDMSIPEMNRYAFDSSINFFTRLSDLEKEPILICKSKGIWIDSFNGEYPKFEDLNEYVEKKYKLAFVSPELHNRKYEEFWDNLKSWILNDSINLKNENLYICTDLPLKAEEFFNK